MTKLLLTQECRDSSIFENLWYNSQHINSFLKMTNLNDAGKASDKIQCNTNS